MDTYNTLFKCILQQGDECDFDLLLLYQGQVVKELEIVHQCMNTSLDHCLHDNTGLELLTGHQGHNICCPWSWPWCPSKVSH